MAYKFKLETLLAYRRSLEVQAQQKLAAEIRILEGHKGKLEELRQLRAKFIADLEERKKSRLSAPVFIFYVEAVRNKEREITAQIILIKSQEQLVEQCREGLIERVKARKVIEKAREKDYKLYQDSLLKLELNAADEMAVLRFGRNWIGNNQGV